MYGKLKENAELGDQERHGKIKWLEQNQQDG